MHERHINRELYFREQAQTTSKHVIPFINCILPVNNAISVLEIGCGEGGNLLPFLEAGCNPVVGIDLAPNKIENARKLYSSIPGGDKLQFIAADIYDSGSAGTFDLVYMRDVLEHIHNQEKFISFVKRFIRPGGILFIGFPPWNNPFGGHQQMCNSKILSKLPWIHLLPVKLYGWLLKSSGETPVKVDGFMEIRETGINIGRFEKIIKKEGFSVLKKTLWFINPNFEIKFGLRPRKLPQFIAGIPGLRNFIATTAYYIISVPLQEQ